MIDCLPFFVSHQLVVSDFSYTHPALALALPQRVTITRMVALGPALLASFCLQKGELDTMNEWLNILQSLQLPFALIPVILLSSSYAIMGSFANSKKVGGSFDDD